MNLGKGLNSSLFKRVISFFEVSKFTLNLDTLHLLITINKVLQVDTSLRSVWQKISQMTRNLSFWAFARKRKIHRNLRHALYILEFCVKFTWIFSSKMLFFRGLPRRFCENGSQWRFVLSFWALAKNPRLKYANSHFKFMDTSLRSVWQKLSIQQK